MLKLNLFKCTVFLIFISVLPSSCKREKITDTVGVNIDRFEKKLFSIHPDSLKDEIPGLYSHYQDFLDVFSYHVIGIGSPASIDYAANLHMFITDRLNREVYDSVMDIFPDLSEIENQLGIAFGRYLKEFPGEELPQVVTYVSRFNHAGFTVENWLGIGLDRYLGSESGYYRKMGLPEYIRRNMKPSSIPSESLLNWAGELFPFNDSVDNVLANLIHEGRMVYFVKSLLPGSTAGGILGFTSDQLRWCEKNEAQMWMYLVEHKLVFSQDQMEIRKLTGPAPYTYYFSSESPGRAAVYTGYRIVEAFARRNPGTGLKELMHMKDFQEILRQSRYNP